MASTQDDADKPKSKRLFINQIDQYQGKNLAKVCKSFVYYLCIYVCIHTPLDIVSQTSYVSANHLLSNLRLVFSILSCLLQKIMLISRNRLVPFSSNNQSETKEKPELYIFFLNDVFEESAELFNKS